MCWTEVIKRLAVAKEPITCYKVVRVSELNGRFYSFFQPEERMSQKGFKQGALIEYKIGETVVKDPGSPGIYTYQRQKRHRSPHGVVLRCTIPVGTKYREVLHGHTTLGYVSDSVVVEELL